MTQSGAATFDCNARRGDAWSSLQPVVDRLFEGIERTLVDSLIDKRKLDVVDIGCGAGATTLSLARRLGSRGTCTGLDVSDALLSVARRRAIEAGLGNVRFIRGDAQRCHLEAASFDAAMSRFGVMFFDRPRAALANIRSWIRPAGTLTFIVWRAAEDRAATLPGSSRYAGSFKCGKAVL